MTTPRPVSAADLAAELPPLIAPALAATLREDILAIAAAAVRLYAESHPRPIQVTKGQAAEMLGVSRPTLNKVIAAGDIRLNKMSMIPISEIDAALAVASRGRSAKRKLS